MSSKHVFECRSKWLQPPGLHYCALKGGHLDVPGPPSGGHGYKVLNSALELTPVSGAWL